MIYISMFSCLRMLLELDLLDQCSPISFPIYFNCHPNHKIIIKKVIETEQEILKIMQIDEN